MRWYDMVIWVIWYEVILYEVIWYEVILYAVILYEVIWYGVIWYGDLGDMGKCWWRAHYFPLIANTTCSFHSSASFPITLQHSPTLLHHSQFICNSIIRTRSCWIKNTHFWSRVQTYRNNNRCDSVRCCVWFPPGLVTRPLPSWVWIHCWKVNTLQKNQLKLWCID